MSIFLACAIVMIAIFAGTLATYQVVDQATLPTRICSGAVLGLALFTWLCLLTSLALGGLTLISIGGAVVVLALIAVYLLNSISTTRVNGDLRATNRSRGEIFYYAAWTALLILLFSRVIMLQPDGLHTSPANNYGDLPFHLSVVTSFAYGENLPPENPIFAGMRFTYPFLIDFLPAIFMKLGVDWRIAFFIGNLPLALALVGLLNFFTFRLTGNRTAARLAPIIFLFGGGLGFINFFADLRAALANGTGLQDFLLHLPHTYTMNAELELPIGKIPLRWGNVFTTLLIPQRSMLLGLPFATMVCLLWWMTWAEGALEAERKRYLLAAGLLAGIMPLLHAHGFFAIMIVSVLMAICFFSLEWLYFFIPAGLLAAPQALYLSNTAVRDELFKPELWWEGKSSPLLFWLFNAGVFIVLALIALASQRLTSTRHRMFYLPFVALFILPNVIKFAPWTWDNYKIFIYWALITTPFVAYAVASLLNPQDRQQTEMQASFARLIGGLLLAALITAGGLDVWRAISPAENTALYAQADLNAAEAIRAKTPPRARILHAPIHNSVISLTGRQSLMGYPGHLWTHGIDYGTRETEVQSIYRGGPLAQDLLKKLAVDFVVIGPVERNQLKADEAFFASTYQKIIDQPEYKVYQITR